MPGFTASKDRLTLLLEVSGAGSLKLKTMLMYYTPNPKGP